MSDKLNRRTILAGAAAVPALAIPAAGAASTFATASEPDPVFATVAAHREAFVEHMRAARLDGKFQVVSEGTRIESEHSKGGTPRAQDKEPEGTKTIRRLPSCIRSE